MGRQTLTYDERTGYPIQTRELPSQASPFRKRLFKTPFGRMEVACSDCSGCDVRLACPHMRGKRHGRVKR
jgi:hypothetical protein